MVRYRSLCNYSSNFGARILDFGARILEQTQEEKWRVVRFTKPKPNPYKFQNLNGEHMIFQKWVWEGALGNGNFDFVQVSLSVNSCFHVQLACLCAKQ